METFAEIRPIRTDDDHRRVLEVLEGLWAAEPGTDDYDRLDVLATLVEAYEARRWPIPELDPIEAISGAIESGEHTRAELAELIGQSRATEVLQRKRYLTLPMIRQIAGNWGLPVGTLVQGYELVTTIKAEGRSRYYSSKAEAVRSVTGKRTRTAAREPGQVIIARSGKTGERVIKKGSGKPHTVVHTAHSKSKNGVVVRTSPKPKGRSTDA